MPDRLTRHAGDIFGPIAYSDTAYLLDATHAWVAETGHGAAFGGGLYIATFRTTDGGKTWHDGAAVAGVSPTLFFLDENHGWLLQSAHDTPANLYSTDDAGLHWNFTSSAAWTGGLFTSVLAVTFSSLTTGWISATDGSLWVTHDGGVTWQVQPLPITPDADGGITPPRFFDPQHGLISAWVSSASPAVLLVTSDGGTTWIVRSLPWEHAFEIDFADADHGWAIAGPGDIFDAPAAALPLPLYKTDDGGQTWAPVQTNILLRTPGDGVIGPFHFVDRNNGFMVRYASQSNGYTQWLKTTDGGRTWTVVVEAPQTP